MICPRCNANNAKDPLQCIRCGYIFPEYIKKHNIDMNRGVSKEDKAEQKRVEAIKNFAPKQNGLNPKSQKYAEVVQKQANLSNTNTNINVVQINRPQPPTKLKMDKIIGRNGINRTEDLKECLNVFYITVIIISIIVIAIDSIGVL